jgi:hypothetical protein
MIVGHLSAVLAHEDLGDVLLQAGLAFMFELLFALAWLTQGREDQPPKRHIGDPLQCRAAWGRVGNGR